MLYKAGAYKSGRGSLKPSHEVKAGMDLAQKLAEENKAIGGTLFNEELQKTDSRYD